MDSSSSLSSVAPSSAYSVIQRITQRILDTKDTRATENDHETIACLIRMKEMTL